ncbi:unnamed protein product [Orchesella dallaii]|uniref:Odorant receptor n=1 Tax=Orchesella dallaii TaxID=48710 RepID=A0ABP1R935_9HEXA
MILKNGLVLTFQEGLQVDSWFHIIPWKWDNFNGKFIIENKSPSKLWRMTAFAFFCVTGSLMLLSCLLNNSLFDIAQRSQMLVTATLLLFCATICWILYTDHVSFIAVLNGLLNMERDIVQDRNMSPEDFRTKIIKWIAKIVLISGKPYAALVSVCTGLDPKFPLNTFKVYSSNVEVLDFHGFGLLYRMLTMLGNLIIWHILSICGIFICLEMLITMEAARVFQLYLLNYTRFSRSTKIWLKIKHFHDRLRLMIQIFNGIHSHRIVVLLLILLSVGQVSSLYCLIRCLELPLPMLTTLVLIVFDSGITIIFVFGCAGELNGTSQLVTAALKRQGSMVKSMLVSKTMTGIADLRIGFGSVNFIERTTPLQYLNFNALRIVDLLLFTR